MRCCFIRVLVWKTKSQEPVGQPHNTRARVEGQHMDVTIRIHGLTVRRNQPYPLSDGSGWPGTLGTLKLVLGDRGKLFCPVRML